VTKTFPLESVREAVASGANDFGENYVQEFRSKYEDLRDEQIRWHFIGHLQRNKVREIVGKTAFIHAVDSIRLGEEISKRAESLKQTVNILVEVNTTDEDSKFGVKPEDTIALVHSLATLPHLNVTGLMTIGYFKPDPEVSRPVFRLLKNLQSDLRKEGRILPHLSMGMSNDFEIAIEEGSTMVRIGTAIFGKRLKVA